MKSEIMSVEELKKASKRYLTLSRNWDNLAYEAKQDGLLDNHLIVSVLYSEASQAVDELVNILADLEDELP